MNDTTGTLYIVGTPIGNLSDMSPRAIRILREVKLVAAEDTRHTKKLMSYFDIHTPLESYHKFSEKEKIPKFIEYLLKGNDMALVSNAGMPGISDPGELLIKEAVKNNICIVPIPGPSALILAIAASGLSTERFVFEGFLPRKTGLKLKRLYSIREETRTMIFYEAGPRLKKTINDMHKIFGDRSCAIARELTKKFEEIKTGNISNVLGQISSLKGEFVVVVSGAVGKKEEPVISLKDEIEKLKKELGISAKDAIKLVASKYDIPKRRVYARWIGKDKD